MQMGGVAQKAPAKYDYVNTKIEEAALLLTPNVAGDIADVLLRQFELFPPETQKKLRDTIGKVSKA